MKVTVTTEEQDCFLLDVSEDLELENFKAFCELESGFSAQSIEIQFHGTSLQDGKKTLKDYGIHDGDLVVLRHAVSQPRNRGSFMPSLDFSNVQVPGASGSSSSSSQSALENDPARVKQMLLSNPEQLALLKQNNAPLADALLNGSLQDFERVLRRQFEEKKKQEQLKLRMLTADPFDTEAQKLIAEEIMKNNINANMEAAMEYNPETFGQVVMLYVNCKVNGHPVKAFIDSGAQATIMSAECAERVNITRLIDNRWAGIARGVGEQRIVGRIHMVQLEIEGIFLTTSFSVLQDQRMDMLLGLDMLKRHQCCIDLRRNVLHIGTTGTETPFLSEADLPETARLTYNEDNDELLTKTLNESKKEAESKFSSQSSSSSGFNPSDSQIQEITKHGFSRDQAISELRATNGNAKLALAALLAKSLKF